MSSQTGEQSSTDQPACRCTAGHLGNVVLDSVIYRTVDQTTPAGVDLSGLGDHPVGLRISNHDRVAIASDHRDLTDHLFTEQELLERFGALQKSCTHAEHCTKDRTTGQQHATKDTESTTDDHVRCRDVQLLLQEVKLLATLVRILVGVGTKHEGLEIIPSALQSSDKAAIPYVSILVGDSSVALLHVAIHEAVNRIHHDVGHRTSGVLALGLQGIDPITMTFHEPAMDPAAKPGEGFTGTLLGGVNRSADDGVLTEEEVLKRLANVGGEPVLGHLPLALEPKLHGVHEAGYLVIVVAVSFGHILTEDELEHRIVHGLERLGCQTERSRIDASAALDAKLGPEIFGVGLGPLPFKVGLGLRVIQSVVTTKINVDVPLDVEHGLE